MDYVAALSGAVKRLKVRYALGRSVNAQQRKG